MTLRRALPLGALLTGIGLVLDLGWVGWRNPGSISAHTVVVLVGGWAASGFGIIAITMPLLNRVGLPACPRLLLVVVYLGVVAAAVLALRDPARAHPAARPSAIRASPNVVLVTIDTLRADHLGSYGYGRATSPFLDRFAGESVRFTQAITQSSWTKPATASLLTSVFPSAHGANFEKARLPDDALLVSEVLRAAGYATAAFSANSWISPSYGFAQGWDTFWVAPVVRGLRLTLLASTVRWANRLIDAEARWTERVLRRLHRGPTHAARDRLLNDAALRWLDARPREPFLLYAHYMSAHRPFEPPPPFDALFLDGPPLGVQDYPGDGRPFAPAPALPPAAHAEIVARYDGAIRHADAMVAALVAALEARGLLERTLIVVTADHGEEFHEHGAWGHGHSLYQELIRVPLLVRLPGRESAGRRVDDLVMTVDLMPTILRLLGVSPPPGLMGRDLTGLLNGTATAWPAEAFSELLYRDVVARALLRDGNKLVTVQTHEGTRQEYYDLARDASEVRDLGSHAVPPLLGARLDAWYGAARGRAVARAPARPDAEDALRALGYVP